MAHHRKAPRNPFASSKRGTAGGGSTLLSYSDGRFRASSAAVAGRGHGSRKFCSSPFTLILILFACSYITYTILGDPMAPVTTDLTKTSSHHHHRTSTATTNAAAGGGGGYNKNNNNNSLLRGQQKGATSVGAGQNALKQINLEHEEIHIHPINKGHPVGIEKKNHPNEFTDDGFESSKGKAPAFEDLEAATADEDYDDYSKNTGDADGGGVDGYYIDDASVDGGGDYAYYEDGGDGVDGGDGGMEWEQYGQDEDGGEGGTEVDEDGGAGSDGGDGADGGTKVDGDFKDWAAESDGGDGGDGGVEVDEDGKNRGVGSDGDNEGAEDLTPAETATKSDLKDGEDQLDGIGDILTVKGDFSGEEEERFKFNETIFDDTNTTETFVDSNDDNQHARDSGVGLNDTVVDEDENVDFEAHNEPPAVPSDDVTEYNGDEPSESAKKDVTMDGKEAESVQEKLNTTKLSGSDTEKESTKKASKIDKVNVETKGEAAEAPNDSTDQEEKVSKDKSVEPISETVLAGKAEVAFQGRDEKSGNSTTDTEFPEEQLKAQNEIVDGKLDENGFVITEVGYEVKSKIEDVSDMDTEEGSPHNYNSEHNSEGKQNHVRAKKGKKVKKEVKDNSVERSPRVHVGEKVTIEVDHDAAATGVAPDKDMTDGNVEAKNDGSQKYSQGSKQEKKENGEEKDGEENADLVKKEDSDENAEVDEEIVTEESVKKEKGYKDEKPVLDDDKAEMDKDTEKSQEQKDEGKQVDNEPETENDSAKKVLDYSIEGKDGEREPSQEEHNVEIVDKKLKTEKKIEKKKKGRTDEKEVLGVGNEGKDEETGSIQKGNGEQADRDEETENKIKNEEESSKGVKPVLDEDSEGNEKHLDANPIDEISQIGKAAIIEKKAEDNLKTNKRKKKKGEVKRTSLDKVDQVNHEIAENA